MIVRDEAARDDEAIHLVVSDAFGGDDEARLVRSLSNEGGRVVSLVAEEDGRIAGHVLLSRMEAPFPALALAPVSVTPAKQRLGIGSALVREAIGRAREGGWSAIFVLGDPAYYERFGFSIEAARGFKSSYAGAHFMMLVLSETPLATKGELRHAPSFATLD